MIAGLHTWDPTECDSCLNLPVPILNIVAHTCGVCGYPLEPGQLFCSDDCTDEAEGFYRCDGCDQPEGQCTCPPPRPVTTVKAKEGLLS